MKSVIRSILLALALLLPACITSLHPYATDETSVFEPSLLGHWTSPDGDQAWEFSSNVSHGRDYQLIQTDKKGIGKFRARLFRIDDVLFLDVMPQPQTGNELFVMHTPPGHFVMLVEAISPTLRVSLLDPEGLLKITQSRADVPARVEVERGFDKHIVFTAPTEQLQRFLAKYAKLERATLFGHTIELIHREPVD